MDRSHPEVIEDYKNGIVNKQAYINKNYASWRAPLWPFTMASILYLFGYNLNYIILFKLLIHLISAYLLYKTLKLLDLRRTISIIGCFIFLISPVYQIYSRVFYAEPMTAFFFSLFIFNLIYWVKTKRWIATIPIFAGFLILTHPYYIFFPFIVYGILWIQKQINFKYLILLAFGNFLIVSIWPLRNHYALDTDSYVLTTSSGPVMAKGWNSYVTELHTNTKGDLANEGLVFEKYKSDKKFTGGAAQSQKYQDAVFQFIKNNPEKIAPIIFTKLKSAFNPLQETLKGGFLETGRELFHSLALLSLVVIFFIEKSTLRSLAISLTLSTIAITIVTYSGFRFRAPQFFLELLIIIYVSNHLYLKIVKP